MENTYNLKVDIKNILYKTMEDLEDDDILYSISKPRFSMIIDASEIDETVESGDVSIYIVFNPISHKPIIVNLVSELPLEKTEYDEYTISYESEDGKSITYIDSSNYEHVV